MPSGSPSRARALLPAAGLGAVAGIVGVAAMTAAELIEQRVTQRPDSYVPARALRTLLGGHPSNAERSAAWNHAMHWGTGALVGALRGVWSAVGIRGPRANLAHAVVRLAFDQTVENGTGVGAPPHTWPRLEQVVDTSAKSVYALVTGMVSDRIVPPSLEQHRGTTSH